MFRCMNFQKPTTASLSPSRSLPPKGLLIGGRANLQGTATTTFIINVSKKFSSAAC